MKNILFKKFKCQWWGF